MDFAISPAIQQKLDERDDFIAREDHAAGARASRVLRSSLRARPYRVGDGGRPRHPGKRFLQKCGVAPKRPDTSAMVSRRHSAAPLPPISPWPSCASTSPERDSAYTTICRTSRRSSAIFRRPS